MPIDWGGNCSFSVILLLTSPAATRIKFAPVQKLPNRFPCGAGLVQNNEPLFQRASLKLADVMGGTLRLFFFGHATLQIESPRGVRVITDYNDFFRASVLPDTAPERALKVTVCLISCTILWPPIFYSRLLKHKMVLNGFFQDHTVATIKHHPDQPEPYPIVPS